MRRSESVGKASKGDSTRMGVAGDHLLQLGELSDSTAKVATLHLGSNDEDVDVTVSTVPAGSECVITQVNSVDAAQTIRRPKSVNEGVSGHGVVEFTWKRKFRNLLCCLAPGGTGQNERYFRANAEHTGISMTRANLEGEGYPGWQGPACLPPLEAADVGKKTLVLDLDETLVHSSFKPVPHADYVIPVEIEGRFVDVYVQKRPYLEEFMAKIAPIFEVVVFTASLGKYADPLMDKMDRHGHIKHRLFREACAPFEGNYVKDLKCLGRKLEDVIIVDNSPHSYVFQPENAVPIGTFIDDLNDQELLEILPILTSATNVKDVRHLLPLKTGMGNVMGYH